MGWVESLWWHAFRRHRDERPGSKSLEDCRQVRAQIEDTRGMGLGSVLSFFAAPNHGVAECLSQNAPCIHTGAAKLVTFVMVTVFLRPQTMKPGTGQPGPSR